MRNLKGKLQDLAVGDKVNYHAFIDEDGPRYEPTSSGHEVEAIAIRNGYVWVWITGKSGCVAFEALSKT